MSIYIYIYIHPQKPTWTLKTMVSNRHLLFQGSIFRYHVSFLGGMLIFTSMQNKYMETYISKDYIYITMHTNFHLHERTHFKKSSDYFSKPKKGSNQPINHPSIPGLFLFPTIQSLNAWINQQPKLSSNQKKQPNTQKHQNNPTQFSKKSHPKNQTKQKKANKKRLQFQVFLVFLDSVWTRDYGNAFFDD